MSKGDDRPAGRNVDRPEAQSRGMNRLEVQRLATELVEGVMGDGFDGYFFNANDDPATALQALEAIGALRTAAIVRRAFDRFPGGFPPPNPMERQTILLDVVNAGGDIDVFEPEDNELFAYPENVEELAAAYLAPHDSDPEPIQWSER